jgi:AcrR family transcriptional regulator
MDPVAVEDQCCLFHRCLTLGFANACWHTVRPNDLKVNSRWQTHVDSARILLVMARRLTESPPKPAGQTEVLGAGGPRSEPTRRAILEAARRAFAARGYEQTTIRAVAADSGIDASMVMRYFGSKAGLFAAASTTDLEAPKLTSVPAARRGEFIVRHFIERWERSPGDDTLVFLLRTAVTNDTVAAELQANFNRVVTAPIAALDARDPERRGSLIGTQLLGLALCRYVLQLEPMASMAAEDVIAGIAPVVQLQLDRLP